MTALKTVEQGYFRRTLLAEDKVRKRLYKRFVTALDSVSPVLLAPRINESEAVVAIARRVREHLLTDAYQRGVADRIERRLGLCSQGVP